MNVPDSLISKTLARLGPSSCSEVVIFPESRRCSLEYNYVKIGRRRDPKHPHCPDGGRGHMVGREYPYNSNNNNSWLQIDYSGPNLQTQESVGQEARIQVKPADWISAKADGPRVPARVHSMLSSSKFAEKTGH